MRDIYNQEIALTKEAKEAEIRVKKAREEAKKAEEKANKLEEQLKKLDVYEQRNSNDQIQRERLHNPSYEES